MSSDVDHDTGGHGHGGHRGGHRTLRQRMVPFVGLALLALVVLPAVETALWAWGYFVPDVALRIEHWATYGSALLSVLAVGIGAMVTQRLPFVTWHVIATIMVIGHMIGTTVVHGWSNNWAVDHLGMSVVLAASWMLYRIDAFRAAARGSTVDAVGKLAQMIRWPKAAKLRTDQAQVDEFAVEVPIEHAGVPIRELRGKLDAINELPGVVRGRSTIIGDKEGGHSTLRIVHTSPDSVWRPWPGLTHPGESFAMPLSTSYYSTGQRAWYSFCRTPEGWRSRLCPDFESPNDVLYGRQGMTRAGKSGDAAIEIAEVCSRRDVVPIYINLAKLGQDAMWCLDFMALAAANNALARVLFQGLRKLGEYRSRILGEAGIRSFGPEAYERLGLAYVYVFADEYDVVKNGADLEWLATKGISLGIRLSFTLPRAVGDKMSTDIRGAVGMWGQWGITQDYDKGFVLSKETIEAGANPEQWAATVPGAHYHDMIPGVDPKMYPIDMRTYRTRQDYADLRRAVEAARATFTPATFTPGELEVLGDVVRWCQPSIVRNGAQGIGPADDDQPAQPANEPPPEPADDDDPDVEAARGIPSREELERMAAQTRDAPTDAAAEAMAHAPSLDLSDVRDRHGAAALQSRGPTPDLGAGKLVPDPSKPKAASPEAARAELDAAIARLAARGVTVFGFDDVRDEMRVRMSAGWTSERFTELTESGRIVPPGITIERLPGAGPAKFGIVRLDGGDERK
jgi:pyruvate/2-oxoglutarate dehydrogenase complex dihydrolipoamide acyltransferase (E2) component